MANHKAPANTAWRGGVLWGRIKVAGRLIRWSLRTDDPALAVSRVKERRQREIAHAHYGDARRTFGDAVAAWGGHIATHVAPSTARRYAVSLGQLEPFLRGAYLDEINTALVGEIVKSRRAQATTATIRRDLTALSSVLAYCEGEEWIEGNAALSRLRRLRERRDPIVLPDHRHIEQVIERAPGNLAKLIRAALLTGCRQDELVSLERRQVDYKRGQITLYRTKTKRARTMDLTPEALAVFQSLPVNLGCKWVFWHGDGRPYANVSSRFAALVRGTRKGSQHFRPFRFHDLRHRYAVEFLKNGGSLYDLARQLGHGSVKVTEIYTAYLTPDEERAAKAAGSRLWSQL